MITLGIFSVLWIWILAYFSDFKSHPRNQPRAVVTFFLLGIIVPALMLCASYSISRNTLPDGYEFVPFYYEENGKLFCSEQHYAKCGDSYYRQSGFGTACWIPGAPMKYEKTDISENFCDACGIFCELPNCVLCGDDLSKICSHSLDTSKVKNAVYCGDCGINTEGNFECFW